MQTQSMARTQTLSQIKVTVRAGKDLPTTLEQLRREKVRSQDADVLALYAQVIEYLELYEENKDIPWKELQDNLLGSLA